MGITRFTLAVLLCSVSCAASAQSLRDFWSHRAPDAIYSSNKSAQALEMCVGLELTEYGSVVVLHGEGVTLVSAHSLVDTLIGVRITDRGQKRELALAARGSIGSAWLKRGTRIIKNCV